MGQAVGRRIEEGPGTQVVDDDRAVAVGQLGNRGVVGRLDETGHGEVGRVDAQDRAGPAFRERRFEIDASRAVRGPDLDELGPAPADDVGDPDAAADLDELAARDDDPTATGQPDGERERGRVVVGDERILGTGQGDQVVLRDPDPCPPASGPEVELEQQVIGGERRPRRERRVPATEPAEVRVDDDAGRVDRRQRGAASMGPAKASNRSITWLGEVVQAGRRGWSVASRSRSASTTSRATARSAAASAGPTIETGRTTASTRSTLGGRGRSVRHSGGTSAVVAGAHGSRTHRATPSAAPLVLKTRGPTGTPPLPPSMVARGQGSRSYHRA